LRYLKTLEFGFVGRAAGAGHPHGSGATWVRRRNSLSRTARRGHGETTCVLESGFTICSPVGTGCRAPVLSSRSQTLLRAVPARPGLARLGDL
jgi:hypothetical protein